MNLWKWVGKGIGSIFANNAGSILVTLIGVAVATWAAVHFYDEWAEERAEGKVRSAIIQKCESDVKNEKQFDKEVKDGLDKVGTDDIFDIIN